MSVAAMIKPSVTCVESHGVLLGLLDLIIARDIISCIWNICAGKLQTNSVALGNILPQPASLLRLDSEDRQTTQK